MMKVTTITRALCTLSLIISGTAQALTFEFDDMTVNWDTSISFATQTRLESRNKSISQAGKGTRVVGTRSDGQPLYDMDTLALITDNAFILNGNDGNNHFDQYDFTSIRLDLITEADFNFGDWGLFIQGKMWRDFVYDTNHRLDFGDDDGRQAWAENNGNPNFGSRGNDNPRPGDFPRATSDFLSFGAELMEAYLYGTFDVTDSVSLDVRFGRQVIPWGESTLSGGGINMAINPFDESAQHKPGRQVKELLMPQSALYLQMSPTDNLTVKGYYQFEWRSARLSPVGSYWSERDAVGIGGNHFALISGTEKRLFGQDLDPVANPEVIPFLRHLPTNCGPSDDDNSDCRALVPYKLRTEKGSNTGQYGMAFNIDLDNGDELGVFYANYHEHLPSFVLPSDPVDTLAPFLNVALAIVDPVQYMKTMAPQGGFRGSVDMGYKLSGKQLAFLWGLLKGVPPQDGSIRDILGRVLDNPDFLHGLSPQLADVLGECHKAMGPICGALLKSIVNPVAGMVLDQWDLSLDTVVRSTNYRLQYFEDVQITGLTYSTNLWGHSISTELNYRKNMPLMSGNINRTPKRWQVMHWFLNSVSLFKSNPLWDSSTLLMESVVWYVPGAEKFDMNDLLNPDRLAIQNDPIGLGFSARWIWRYNNVFNGWDMEVPWHFKGGLVGSMSTSGYKQGQYSFATGITFKHISDFEIGLDAVSFFGETDEPILMMQQDRDSLSLHAKYSF